MCSLGLGIWDGWVLKIKPMTVSTVFMLTGSLFNLFIALFKYTVRWSKFSYYSWK
jgi:hypothetical protein